MGTISRQLVSAQEAAMLLGMKVPEAELFLRRCGVLAEECGGEAWYDARAVCRCIAQPNCCHTRQHSDAENTTGVETTTPA